MFPSTDSKRLVGSSTIGTARPSFAEPRYLSTAPHEMDSYDQIYDINSAETSSELADLSLRHIKHKRIHDGINKTGFMNLVKEVTNEVVQDNLKSQVYLPGEEVREFRFSRDASETLHLSSEAFLENVIYDASLCMHHGRRVTLMDRDLRLARRLRGHVTDQFT